MVLKKSKWSGSTGNTQRRYHNQSGRDKKAAHITLVQSFQHEGQPWDRLQSQREIPPVGVQMTLNKKKRWLITEELEEAVDSLGAKKATKRQCDEKDKRKPQKKGKRNKREQNHIQDTLPTKTTVYETVKMTRGKCCKAVYRLDEENPMKKKSKSWKTRKETLVEQTFEDEFEIESDLPSLMWPYNVHSTRNKQLAKDKASGNYHYLKKNKYMRDNNLIYQEEDDIVDMDDGDIDEAWEESNLYEDIEDRETKFCLLDFVTEKESNRKMQRRFSTKQMENKKERVSIEDLSKYEHKSHIIYTEVDETFRYLPASEGLAIQEEPEEIKGETQGEDPFGTSGPAFLQYLESEVVITTSSISHYKLKASWGKEYFEAAISPRCFAVFVGKTFGSEMMSKGHTCFVVINHISENKAHETTLVKMRVFTNGPKFEMAQILPAQDKCPFDQLILNLQKVMSLTFAVNGSSTHKMAPLPMRKLTKWQPRSVDVSEALNMLASEVFAPLTGECQEDSDSSCYGEVVFMQCQICYEQLAESPLGMYHKQCLHTFCRACWHSHLTTRIDMQAQSITCPGFKCKSEIDIATILSIVAPEKAKIHIKAILERCLARQNNWQWCPNCDKAAFCSGYTGLQGSQLLSDIPTVRCPCRRIWCFECKEEQHWPATCDVAKEYRGKLKNAIGTVFDVNGELFVTELDLKPCPFCKTPIDKNNGCTYMLCRCNRAFCWACLSPMSNHKKCIPVAVEKKIFTSVDALSHAGKKKFMENSFEHRFQVNRLTKKRTKLGLARQSTHLSKVHPEESKEAKLKQYFDLAINTHKILEYFQLARMKSESRHYQGRVSRFLNAINLPLKRFVNELLNADMKMINMKEVLSLSANIETHLQNLKRFGL